MPERRLVVDVPFEMFARIEAAKAMLPINRRRSMRQVVLNALDKGLPDGRGRTSVVRDIQGPDFIEISDYLREAVDIYFLGRDIDFLIERYGVFLLEKLNNEGRLDFTLAASGLESRVARDFIGALQVSEKFRDQVRLFSADDVPMNLVWDMRSMVGWTSFKDVRGPFLYVPDSVISPGMRLLEYRHNLNFDRRLINGYFSQQKEVSSVNQQ